MAIGDEDLGIYFSDWNKAELANGSTFGCTLDYPEQLDNPFGVKAGQVQAKPSIRYATKDAPGLKSGDLVKVDGVQWVVRESRKEGDGQISVAELRSPGAQ